VTTHTQSNDGGRQFQILKAAVLKHFVTIIFQNVDYYCLSNAFDRLSLVSVCVCVYFCPQIGCRTITSAILDRFSPNFARRSEIWLFRRLLFLGQTGSRLPILYMCKVRFWQFRDCGGHIFPRI